MRIEVDKINLADMIVIVALSIALFVSISYSLSELSMSIASGLLGYIGGATKHTVSSQAPKSVDKGE